MESVTNQEQKTFILQGSPRIIGKATVLQDVGRTVDLVAQTVLGLDVSVNKYIPLEDLNAVDGTVKNVAIYLGPTVLAATIAAGDVVIDSTLIGGDVVVREDMIVVEGANTLDTAYGVGALATTLREELYRKGIFAQNTKTSTNFA